MERQRQEMRQEREEGGAITKKEEENLYFNIFKHDEMFL